MESSHNQSLTSNQRTSNQSNNDKKKERKEDVRKKKTNKEPINIVEKLIIDDALPRFTEIAELKKQKDILTERVILPLKFPQLFKGMYAFKSNVFIHGPPGVGKTFIAKACAEEANATLFHFSPGDILSRYIDGEKLVKEVFKLAREKAPSIILFDEIDYMFSPRNDTEAETPRRIITEVLIQMMGLKGEDNVIVLGVGNMPWELNISLRRRFEKWIYIPLPDFQRRKSMIEKELVNLKHILEAKDIEEIAARTEGFSCSDLSVLLRDAYFQPLREIQKSTYFKKVETLPNGKSVYAPCNANDEGAEPKTLMDLDVDQMKLRDFNFSDVEIAFKQVKPSVLPRDVERYQGFQPRRIGQSV